MDVIGSFLQIIAARIASTELHHSIYHIV